MGSHTILSGEVREEEKIQIDEAGNLTISQGTGSGASAGEGKGIRDQQMFDDNMEGAADNNMGDTAMEGKKN